MKIEKFSDNKTCTVIKIWKDPFFHHKEFLVIHYAGGREAGRKLCASQKEAHKIAKGWK